MILLVLIKKSYIDVLSNWGRFIELYVIISRIGLTVESASKAPTGEGATS